MATECAWKTTNHSAHRFKFHETVEAAGTWVLRTDHSPITFIWTLIRVVLTLYLTLILALQCWFASPFWLGIYGEWMLAINTFGSLLSAYTTVLIWHKYTRPNSFGSRTAGHYQIAGRDADLLADSETEIELALTEEQQLSLHLNLHSDTDATEEDSLHRSARDLSLHAHSEDDNEHHCDALNAMRLSDISYGLLALHRLSALISQIGLSAQAMVAVSFWAMLDYEGDDSPNDESFGDTLLNVQVYAFVPMLLFGVHCASFEQMHCAVGVAQIIVFDAVWVLFIAAFDVLVEEKGGSASGMSLMAQPSDSTNDTSMALVMAFVAGHSCVLMATVSVKRWLLLRHLRRLKMEELRECAKGDVSVCVHDAVSAMMRREDFECAVGADFVRRMRKRMGRDGSRTVDDAQSSDEGSDVGYSSHDFNRSEKCGDSRKSRQSGSGNGRRGSRMRMRLSLESMFRDKWSSLRNSDSETDTDAQRADNSAVRVVFGSNIHQRFDAMPAVRALTTNNPDIVVFVGNNIYLDEAPRTWGVIGTDIDEHSEFRYRLNGLFSFWKTLGVSFDPSSEYQRLLKHRDFILCNRDDSLPVCLATWADHDFLSGRNKFHAKSAFLAFLDTIDMRHELSEHIDVMSAKTYRGIYYHYDSHHVFREENEENEENEEDSHVFIRTIMLDLNFDRSASDMFGSEQWQWLCGLLKNSMERKDQPDWHLVCFGNPCLVEEYDLEQNMRAQPNPQTQTLSQRVSGNSFKLPNLLSPIPMASRSKAWDAHSKKKLMRLLTEAGIAERTLFLSGGVCYSQVLRHTETGVYEFVASSLTHCIPSVIPHDYYINDEYESASKETDVCCQNGYGYLEIRKNEWQFCVKDADGKSHIALSQRL